MPKRKRWSDSSEFPVKKRLKQRKINVVNSDTSHSRDYSHTILHRYFSQVLTLREYLLRALPATSRLRRKRIASFIEATPDLGALLDGTLVAFTNKSATSRQDRSRDLQQFVQTQRQSKALSATASAQQFSLDEVSTAAPGEIDP